MMLILPPLLVFDVFLLLRNLREQPLALERIRTRLVIAGWVSCFALAVAEILTRSVVALPATLIPSVLLTLAVFRFRLLDDAMPLAAIHTVALLIIAVASGAIAVSLLSFNWALVAIALMLILVTLYVLVSHTLEELLRRRQQIDRLAVLGRMLSQLAHDIKNPLAAMKGAAQFLKEERAQGRSIDDQSAFLDMIIAESDRLTRLVDRYQRLRKLEPVCRPANVNEVVQQVVARQALQVDGNHARVELHPHLPECQVDPDLLDTALQNLLTNSIEASSAADEPVLIRTEPLGRESRPHGVAITIEDHGLGMNPRDMEQAFDEFFTTKAQGSGLGLPLVRGVVDAHGGKLQVRSGLGEGTSVRIELPLRTELPSNTEAT
jgi:signal transduction histidine kinase